MDEGCDKNSAILGTTEIINEFLLPLVGFAVSIGRAAAEMGSEARFTGEGRDGKMALFTRRAVARMELIWTAVYHR
jgi:hypothetical protein